MPGITANRGLEYLRGICEVYARQAGQTGSLNVKTGWSAHVFLKWRKEAFKGQKNPQISTWYNSVIESP